MHFREMNIECLIDTGDFSSDNPEANLSKNQFLASRTKLSEDPSTEFQILVAIGQLESPIAAVELQFEVGDSTFREKLRYDKS